MSLLVIDHPLVTHRSTVLRNENTPLPVFRRAVAEIAALLADEATRTLPVDLVTALAPTGPPEAEVGMIGMRRNEETFEPEQCAEELPRNQNSRDVFVLDPMLPTGGLEFTCQLLMNRGAETVTAVPVISAPEGVMRVQDSCPGVRIVTAALDPGPNDRAFIGLGDAGDRLIDTSISA